MPAPHQGLHFIWPLLLPWILTTDRTTTSTVASPPWSSLTGRGHRNVRHSLLTRTCRQTDPCRNGHFSRSQRQRPPDALNHQFPQRIFFSHVIRIS